MRVGMRDTFDFVVTDIFGKELFTIDSVKVNKLFLDIDSNRGKLVIDDMLFDISLLKDISKFQYEKKRLIVSGKTYVRADDGSDYYYTIELTDARLEKYELHNLFENNGKNSTLMFSFTLNGLKQILKDEDGNEYGI